MKEYLASLIFDAFDRKVDLELIKKTTVDSKLSGFDYASTIFISNKTLNFEYFKKNMLKNKGIACVENINGFANICLDRIYFLNKISFMIEQEDRYVMVEFSSPNTNKPLHVGHIRNTLLGNALSNLLSKKYKVIKANLVNDRGIHICKSMLGYKRFSKYKTPEEANEKPDLFVGDCYVLFNKAEKENPDVIKDAEEMLKKWEAKDENTIKLWKKMNKWALDGLKQTYSDLGIKFDVWYFESDFYDKGKKIIFDSYNKGLVDLDYNLGYMVKYGDKPTDYKVVLRKDGTSIYITQDIYLAKLKTETYNLDKNIYVVGSEQNDYFHKLKAVITHLGMSEISDKIEHYSYGMIYLPSGKMKSREGNIVDADTLIQDVRTMALRVLKEKNPNKKEANLQEESKQIADAAIKYFILKYDAKKDFVFDINSSLAFDGNSGPYILYTYARICSLLGKMQEFGFEDLKEINEIPTKDEMKLSKKVIKYRDRLNEAIDKQSVHFLVNYITDIANRFNSVYAKVKFITDSKNEVANRYLLYSKMKHIFEDVFDIMGIKPLKRM